MWNRVYCRRKGNIEVSLLWKEEGTNLEVSLLWEEEGVIWKWVYTTVGGGGGEFGSESAVGGGRGNVEVSLLWEEEG
jgi:hypothetical protein